MLFGEFRMGEGSLQGGKDNSQDNLNPDPNTKQLERGEPFFEDGNVVLIAERTYYKVYKGILSKQSEFFRDLFSLPQPAKAEQIDGCPVVHMHDTPKDVAYILSALYDTHVIRENKLPFVIVSAMLRLGSKYQIGPIREEALRRLNSCFPEEFKDFRTHRTTYYDNDDPYFIRGEISLTAEHAIAAINLARTLNVPSILGPAFYTCAQLDYHTWIHGIVDEDGTHWELSRDDFEKCIYHENSLREAWLRGFQWMFPPRPSPSCLTKEKCTAGISTSAERLRKGLANQCQILFDPQWIDDLASGQDEGENEPRGFCQTCAAHFKPIYEKERKQAWQDLGEYPGVAPYVERDDALVDGE